MKEAYRLYQSVPADVLIAMCLFLGAMARLARNESISAWAAGREFYYSLIVGASLTGFVIWLAEWDLKSGWWIALAAPMACSVVVEIFHKKAEQIRDMDLKETVIFIFDEIKKRLTKTSPTP
ncbi:hypothetical protein GO755_30335 [Spirosoma sp. HMF4905]|uniref:Uncharacterized protein n=1 Tax=Spirosoma arboris TaxID=2682092 RepID=A0A7K1SKN7_9BACT|nr:hypothetical protein [Spirosoma arboris]MVM34369.1 hypothetical protein [Spirosoma arboris]